MNQQNMTTERFVPYVIEKVECRRHKRDKGEACWPVIMVDGTILDAVCNKRAKSAGFNGSIDPVSLNAKARNFSKKG